MSFRENAFYQMTMDNSVLNLTDREKKFLDNSWAAVFADEVFPTIDERPFSVLYDDSFASKPNTPVNVIVGALIIQQMFSMSDDYLVESLMFDVRLQMALHTSSFKEQPLSDKTLSRFRRRCYEHEMRTGIDLYHECISSLSANIAKLMNISGNVRRMDSLMIESNIRNLSRLELLYCCIAKCVKYLKSVNKCEEQYLHYLERGDYNNIFYRNEDNTILEDANALSKLDYDSKEFLLLRKCINEQAVVENGTIRFKEKGEGAPSDALQNPADPDSTFRKKLNSKHKGYSANIVESVDVNGSVITEYAYEPNIHSDKSFADEYIDKQNVSETEVLIVADGGYSAEELKQIAESKNIKLVTTNMLGIKPDAFFSDFEVEDNSIIKCPNGIKPTSSKYNSSTNKITAAFDQTCCDSCPNRDKCRPKQTKAGMKIVVSTTTIARAKELSFRSTDDFKDISRLRNGVETIPSILRNRYHVDRMPVRGKIKTKFYFGCMIGAINFRKFYRYRQGSGCYAENPILSRNAG